MSVAVAYGATIHWSARIPIEPHRTLTAVTCPSAAQCTAVDRAGDEVTFDPRNRTWTAPQLVDDCDPWNFTCPCPPGQVDSNDDPCPTTAQAREVLDAVACPSVSECVAVDGNGAVVEFDPQPGGMLTQPAEIDPGDATGFSLLGVACPRAMLCVATDEIGGEGDFNPFAPPPPDAGNFDGVDIGAELDAVACPTAAQCTTVDNQGYELTFNPASDAQPKRVQLERTAWLNSVACPSATQCTTVDRHGHALTFDPRRPRVTVASIDTAGLNGIACPGVSLCLAADRHGRVAVGRPGGSWKVMPIPAAGPLPAIACPSRSLCVVVDSAGNAFVGRLG
jgi:hypothetical protein